MADAIVWKKLTNRRKDVVRKAIYAHAFAQCRPTSEAFVACMDGRMLSVVWACRVENRTMNDCLHQYTNTTVMQKAFDVEEQRINELRNATKS